MQGSQVERTIRGILGISDCYLHKIKNTAGQLQSILYFVAEESHNLAELQSTVIKLLAEQDRPDFWVPINTLPYNLDGDVDVFALETLSVFDQQGLEHNLAKCQEQFEQQDVVAILASASKHTPPLYLDDLIQYPVSQIGTNLHNKTIRSEAISDGQKLAISDGGSLTIPANSPEVLIDCLVRSAAESIPKQIISYSNLEETSYDYKQLLAQASRVLNGLRQNGFEPGEPIIFQFRDNAQFLVAFWGCLLGGFVPVPMAVPADYQVDEAGIENLQRVSLMLGEAAIITSADLFNEITSMPWPEGRASLKVINYTDLLNCTAAHNYHQASADDVTLIMLTSGSTGAPKGVPLTHKNLICRSIGSIQVNGFSQQSRSLNWMPLDHVAGIIYFHIRDVYLGCTQIHVAAPDILQAPLKWLDLLERYQATVTFAPNFAFGLIAGLSDEIEQRKWDLSALKLVLNGGEAVVAATARQFLQLLQASGLSKHAMCPAWGMSETSSGITYARDFELHSTSDTDTHVSVGPPIPGDTMRITDTQGCVLKEGEIGRLQVKGHTVFAGYYQNEAENEEAFTDDGWFNTGDLGKLIDGKLTITGREKDVIIVNGVNYSGPGIENIVEDIEGVTRSYTAACAVADPRLNGAERLAVFFVCEGALSAKLIRNIKGQITSKAGVSPHYIVPLESTDIPKTSIGKIQRTKLKAAFEAGEYHQQIKSADILLGNHCLPAWFYQLEWQRSNPHNAYDLAMQQVVILGDESHLCLEISKGLAALGARPILVNAGDQLNLHDVSHYQIRPDCATDYAELFDVLEAGGKSIQQILCLWPQIEQFQSNAHSASAHLHCAISACANGLSSLGGLASKKQLAIISDAAQPLSGSAINLAHSGLPALIKTLRQEIPQLNYHLVDLDFSQANLADIICSELTASRDGRDIAWRDGLRFRSGLSPCVLTKIQQDPLFAEKPSGFVISGGTGGIGQILTKVLLRSTYAQVLVLGSTTQEQLAFKHQAFNSLLKNHHHLKYASVDLTDSVATASVIEDWLNSQPIELKGVFHLAGNYHEVDLKNETAQGFRQLESVKLMGALSLSQIVAKYSNAYMVNFSSTAGVFGGALIGSYAVASCMLDAVSHKLRAKGVRCFDINWSSWRSTGMSEGNLAIDALRSRGILELDIEAALNSLRLILNQPDPGQFIVGLDPDNEVIGLLNQQVENRLLPAVFVAGEQDSDNLQVEFQDDFAHKLPAAVFYVEHIPRLENGDVDYAALEVVACQGNSEIIAAQTPTQKALVDIWKKVLAIDTVSIHWNFFDVGGQSITATKLIAAISNQFAVQWTLKNIFGAPTCQLQAQAIDQALQNSQSQHVDIPMLERSKPIPLSSAQKRLWFIEQLDISTSGYNVTAYIGFNSTPEVAKIRACLNEIVASQESLRSVFPSHQGVPQLTVLEKLDINIGQLSVNSASQFEAALIQLGSHHFDLTSGPLMHATLIDHSGKFYLALTLHHIISDGWSMSVLFKQFEQLYCSPSPLTLPINPVQYADYAAWQQSRLESGDYASQLQFWQSTLKGGLSGFTIPTDYPRPQVQTYSGKRLVQRIPTLLSGQIQQFSTQQNVTHFVMMLSAFNVLLYRYSQQRDVLIGTVVANRDYAEIENLIGFFVNPVVLRTVVEQGISFEHLLQNVKQTTLDAVANHNIPFEYLTDKLQPPRDTSRSPLFQIAFDFRDPNLTTSQSADLAFSVMEADLGTSKYDLHLTLEATTSEIIAYWEFNTDLFTAQSIELMGENYQRILESIVSRPHQLVDSIDILSPREIALLKRRNQTDAKFLDDKCMHQLFESMVLRHPEQAAVVYAGQSMSYQQLNAKANQLARKLMASGATSNSIVAICIERSLDTIICVLAILKSGAAYLALDPSYPQNRLAFMLDDSKANILLTRSALSERFIEHDINIVHFDDALSVSEFPTHNLKHGVSPHDLAYVIYTSGSTGTPKGVLIEHRGWCNIAQAQIDTFGLRQGMKVLQFASMSFDASAFELAMAWGSGGTLFMGAKEDILPGPALAHFLEKHQIEVVTLPPTALNALPDVSLPNLQVVTVAGEACPESLVKRWANSQRRFFNLYGPTETTIWASYAECFATDGGVPVIGRPVANTQLYIVDSQLNLLPAGMPGELCIAGVGLAREYLSRPQLNAERFVPNPYSKTANARMYRSGDLVRYRTDGAIEFLGRIDHQVKVRGFRIELGEIESLLRKFNGVTEAVVVTHQTLDSDIQLIGYVSALDPATLDPQSIREFLKQSLTDYMVPAQIFVLPSLPLSLNGKVDRKALPTPESLRASTERVVTTAKSNMETLISDIWKSVLSIDAIDVQQNFFDIGGHSLKMAQVQTLLSESLKQNISLVDLFQYTTIKSLAAYLDELQNGSPVKATSAQLTQQKSKVSGQQRLAKMAALKKRQGR
ncbi:non-ribosomal peptide synthetase [Aliiglaciecola sp. LCG003]|uniref:non-ribosomal peptide synthetase n=1 Tax=Aliiglaciecola sp. LCG003 TaxID=3053655 RepID=UPI0025731CF7|nr:non-ribosomal peptide synthetase [Aliiglaciecola sp. LCG003]WJG09753.1 amino acid adenylation domain-containing protein [Aliiglaciecola sp. LCG003]